MESTTVWKVLYILAVLYTSCLDVTSGRQDGGWSSWSSFSPCTLSCAGGRQVRSRTCSNPFPLHGGRACPGRHIESRSCNTQQCPVNGQWTNWSSWSQCSKTCGGGTRSRTRSCTNPPPSNGGAQCLGPGSQTEICGISCGIKVDGGWSSWSSFSPCTLSCAGGTQVRSRTCSNPFPLHGGRACPGRHIEKRSCNTQQCPVDGGWSSWSPFSLCTLSCGGGTQVRSRTCSKPFPLNGGRKCPGKNSEKRSCNTDQCPVDGGWSSWGPFSPCDEGIQIRYRTCTNPLPQHGGRICQGNNSEERTCTDIEQ